MGEGEIVETLLQSYFVLIESELIKCIYGTEYDHMVPKIHQASIEERYKFLKRIQDPDGRIKSKEITYYLNMGILAFYEKSLACFPYGLIPPPLWEKIDEYQRNYIFIFLNTLLDWRKLLNFFIVVHQTAPTQYKLIINFVQLCFGFTIRELIVIGLPFDENIAIQNTKLCFDCIGDYHKELLYNSLQRYESPPLQQRILEIKEQIAIYKEQMEHVLFFKMPPFGKPGDILVVPAKIHIDWFSHLIKLLVVKAEKLQTTIDRERASYGQNLSLNRLTDTDNKSQGIQYSFESYIEEPYRGKLMPFLKQNYTNQKPVRYGYMLYALVESNYMPERALNSNQTALHKSLEATFGEIGTRQSLNNALYRLNPSERIEEDKRHIEEHKQQISKYLETVGPD